MKKIIVVFCLCILIMQQNKLKAQATWDFNHTTWLTYTSWQPYAYWFNYLTVDSISPDTIINAVTYKKIRDNYGTYSFAIRSVNHKLYGIDAGMGPLPHHEYLMYDFAANVGDTVYNVAAGHPVVFTDTTKAYVVAKDSFLLNNKYYNTLQIELFNPFGVGSYTTIWYENIGSDQGLIEAIGWNSYGFACYSNNDSTVDLQSLPTQWNFTTDTVPISPGNNCFAIPWNNGINEQQDEATIEIFPNPSTGKFTIESTKYEVSSIKITNLLGETIFQSEIKNPKSEINLSGVARGIYFVRVEDEKKNVINRKIIVQ